MDKDSSESEHMGDTSPAPSDSSEALSKAESESPDPTAPTITPCESPATTIDGGHTPKTSSVSSQPSPAPVNTSSGPTTGHPDPVLPGQGVNLGSSISPLRGMAIPPKLLSPYTADPNGGGVTDITLSNYVKKLMSLQKGHGVSSPSYSPGTPTLTMKGPLGEQAQKPKAGDSTSMSSFVPTTLPPQYMPTVKVHTSHSNSSQLLATHATTITSNSPPINCHPPNKTSNGHYNPSHISLASPVTNPAVPASKHKPANTNPQTTSRGRLNSYSPQSSAPCRLSNPSSCFEVGFPMYMPHGQDIPMGPSFGHGFYGPGGNTSPAAVQFAPAYPPTQFQLVNFRPDAGLVMAAGLQSQSGGIGGCSVGGREMDQGVHSCSDIKPLRGRKRTLSQSTHRLDSAGDDGRDQDLGGYPTLIRDSIFPTGGQVKGEGGLCGDDGASDSTLMIGAAGAGGSAAGMSISQQLKWQAHMIESWHGICDGALQDIPEIGFRVETDKGFHFSVVDDSFVCQKKNHFQVTVNALFHRTPKFLKMKDGTIQPIERFRLLLHGVKFDNLAHVVPLEKSQPDRSKVRFDPAIVDVPDKPEEPIRITNCRLHFSETTANNMRKRGKPNPDQKHFSLVVCLNAETVLGSFLVVAHVSERIIVRASNPGNFDNDCDYSWFRAANPEYIYHHGRVGINTDKPDEALSVNGSIQLTGQLLQASDMRLKRNIRLAEPRQRLANISRLQLYEYQYADGAVHRGAGTTSLTGHTASGTTSNHLGVLAQEIQMVIPDAVKETASDIVLSDGSLVSRVKMVDKDRVLMEAVGAVQELKRITDQLEDRLVALEQGRSCDHHLSTTANQYHSRRSITKMPLRTTAQFTVMTMLVILLLGSLMFLVVVRFKERDCTDFSAAAQPLGSDASCSWLLPNLLSLVLH